MNGISIQVQRLLRAGATFHKCGPLPVRISITAQNRCWSPSNLPPLVALARVVLEDAKKLRAKGRWFQRYVLGLAVLAVIVQAAPSVIGDTPNDAWLAPAAKTVAYFCALIGLVLQGARWWCQRLASDKHALGSTIKRRALLTDALGPSHEQLDIRLLRQQAGAQAERAAHSYPMPNAYYASEHPPGMERLRQNLQESAFFTHSLYSKAAGIAFVKFTVSSVCIVVGLLIIAVLASREVGTVVANCVLAFVSFLVSVDYLGQAMSWRSGSASVERVERRLEKIAPDGIEPYMAAFADYETATALAPAIPTALYERERDRLDALWRSRTDQR